MPLKKDEKGGGSEADGRRSCVYCSSCYVGGRFVSPDMTVEEMQKFVVRILRDETRMPGIFRWFAVRQIPKLKRWKA